MENPNISTVRSLKGAPATVILALAIAGASLNGRELQRWTAYSDRTVTKACDLLVALGLVQYNGRQYGWSLSDGGRQLPLPTLEDRKFYDLAPSSSSIDLVPSEKDGEEEEKRELLVAAGIGRNSVKMAEILACGYGLDYLRAHVSAFEAERGGRVTVGTLIIRLLSGDPAPAVRCGYCGLVECICT